MVARGGIPINVLLVGDALEPVGAALDGSDDGLLGPTVDRVRGPSDVEAHLADGSIDAVVAAWAGTETDGSDVLATLRAVDPDCSFVPLVDDESAADAAMAVGADDYLLRSVAAANPDVVRTRVGRAVAAGAGLGRPGSPDWYEALLEQSMDALTVLDLDGTITYQNPSVDRLLGYDREELVGTDSLEYVHPDDRGRVEETFADLYERGDGATEEIEFRFRAADGSWEWFESIATTRLGRGIGGYVVNSRLITERKAREHEVDRYETLLSVMPDTMVVTDLDGQHVDIYGFEGWSGYDREELLDEDASLTMPEEDRERAREVVTDLIQSEDREKATYEAHVETRDGELIPFENHVTPLPPDDGGEIPGTMTVLRNISDRKEREQRLEQAETVFQNVRDGVFLMDVTDDDRFVYQRVNDAFEELTTLREADVRGQTPRDVVPDPAVAATIESEMAEVVETRSPHHDEREISIQGRTAHWETWMAPVVVEDEVVSLVGVIRDVTERRRRQQELELKNRAMNEAPIGITVAAATAEGPEITYVNDGFEQLTGYGVEDFDGEGWTILHGDETDPAVVERLEDAYRNEEAISTEVLIYRKDGTPRWFKVNLSPLFDDEGVATHFVGFQQDITDLKEYETEIERRFDEFADVFAEDLRDPIEAAHDAVTAALENGTDDELAAAVEWLEHTDDLLADLATVHSFSVPSREHSEAALRGSTNPE